MPDTAFSDSYIATDAILEAMIGSDPRASAVALKAASAATQEWYCQEATRHIDALPLAGTRYEPKHIENGSQTDYDSDGITQTLEFPRIIDGVVVEWDYGADLPIVPADVKRACLEEAVAIYAAGTSGGRQQLQEEGVASYQIPGIIAETFVAGSGGKTLRSSEARRLMRRYTGAEIR